MRTLLTESDLLSAMTAGQLEDIREQAPAGEDPVAVIMVQSCATVDGYVGGRTLPPPLLTKWARDLAVFDLVKILDKPTEAQKTAYDNALKALEDVRDGKYADASAAAGAPNGGGTMGWGSRKKIS